MGRHDGEEKEELNYEDDISINKHRLDREFITHPKKHMKYAKLAAQATKAAARAHEKVKVIRSEIIIKIFAGGEKPTGTVLEARYRTDPDHIAAKKEQLDADETAQLLNEAVLAFRARRSSLENLARLQQSGYYSSPKAPEGSGMSAQEVAEQTLRDKQENRD